MLATLSAIVVAKPTNKCFIRKVKSTNGKNFYGYLFYQIIHQMNIYLFLSFHVHYILDIIIIVIVDHAEYLPRYVCQLFRFMFKSSVSHKEVATIFNIKQRIHYNITISFQNSQGFLFIFTIKFCIMFQMHVIMLVILIGPMLLNDPCNFIITPKDYIKITYPIKLKLITKPRLVSDIN